MKLIHHQWQIIGQVLIVDDEDNAQVLGSDSQGNAAKSGTITIGVDRFRGNCFEEAYQKAKTACDELLEKHRESNSGNIIT